MNPCLRAIVRSALYVGCTVFYVKEGYQGMIDDEIQEATWDSVSSIIHRGGTVIGSARSKEFLTDEGKMKAIKNLITRGINHLIVIGGDGSLTGAHELKKNWTRLLDNLVSQGLVTKDLADQHPYVKIVGTVGTIDNDFSGTDMTIGADSALHRIQEAVDSISSTAYSHKRTFILEVMGRHCGYLALKTALTCEADYVFVPEMPPPMNWAEDLEKKIKIGFVYGKRLHIIVLSEGAVDENHEPITADKVKQVLVGKMKIDTRVTVLGHVQRGGSPSAFDRILGSRLGAETVLAVLELHQDDEPVVVVLYSNQVQRVPLTTAVEKVKKVKQLLDENKFDEAIELRGRSFKSNFQNFKILSRLEPKKLSLDSQNRYNIAVLHIGTPVCGMNACLFSFVRNCLHRGSKVFGIFNGIEGFLAGHFREIQWSDVTGLVSEGGSYLGTKRTIPTDEMYPKFADQFDKYKIDGFLIIGGFEGYQAALEFIKRRDRHKEFRIPIALIPATINNNVPGSDFSVGADTAVNIIMKACDLFRQSALGTKRRVFIVETMGGKCGYLATAAGIASGVDSSWIFEEPYNIQHLTTEVEHMKMKMIDGKILRGLVLRNEMSSDNYNTDFFTRLYAEEGKHVFTARKNILGHVQQGDTPSVFDRSLAVKLSVNAVQWFFRQFENGTRDSEGRFSMSSDDSSVVIGIFGNQFCNTKINDLLPLVDMENRLVKCEWWMMYRPLLKILACHNSVYNDPNFR
ncbi:ATP-dependent 6-phosphofructokinase-like [Planococcus citri]|uniref:ATP-dependent 6-phosphofructokinase-like n=1 Tax=Planococcus citri TaxID=170843 RepID=UPI0031F95FAA